MHVIVLRQVDVGESDRIASLLTAERGRVEARVPRARKGGRRFGGLDLFVLAEVGFAPGRGAPKLSSARILGAFPRIRSDLVRVALASYAAELLQQASVEEHESPELFRLARAALESLDRPEGEEVGGLGWARAFELKLLHVLGVRPRLRRCAVSGRELSGTPGYWSTRLGGVLSGEALQEDPLARPIPDEVLARLDEALRRPLVQQAEVPWTARTAREASSALRDFVAEHVGVRDRARRFLEQVAGLLLLALVAGCAAAGPPESVRLQGYLFDTADPFGGESSPDLERQVEGALGTAWTDQGELLGESSTPYPDAPGWHRFEGLPPSTALHLVFEAPAAGDPDGSEELLLTTVLSGRTAPEDLWVDPGSFHMFSRAEADTWVEDWFDAVPKTMVQRPSFDPEVSDGGMVLGRLADPGADPGLRVVFRDPAGFDREAWYTDDDGVAIGGQGTSEDGGFVVFGLSPGPIEVLLFDADGAGHGRSFVTRVEEDAVTSLLDFVVVD